MHAILGISVLRGSVPALRLSRDSAMIAAAMARYALSPSLFEPTSFVNAMQGVYPAALPHPRYSSVRQVIWRKSSRYADSADAVRYCPPVAFLPVIFAALFFTAISARAPFADILAMPFSERYFQRTASMPFHFVAEHAVHHQDIARYYSSCRHFYARFCALFPRFLMPPPSRHLLA